MENDFIIGVISGSAATLAGFSFTIAWDLWKMRREDKRRTRAMLAAVWHEMDENDQIANTNLSILKQELTCLPKFEQTLILLQPFKYGVWELLKANLPDKLLANTKLLVGLRDESFSVSRLNEAIASRQRYKDTSGAMGNFTQVLTLRNQEIVAEINKFFVGREETLRLLAKNS